MKTQFDETLLQDLDNFIQCYQFIDDEKIYTNGSELIQVSRIKQWFDYNNKKQKKLEEENEKSNNDIKLLLKENRNKEKVIKKQEEILNKAIEYINDNVAVCAFGNKELPHWEFNDNNIFELLKILKGSEE